MCFMVATLASLASFSSDCEYALPFLVDKACLESVVHEYGFPKLTACFFLAAKRGGVRSG